MYLLAHPPAEPGRWGQDGLQLHPRARQVRDLLEHDEPCPHRGAGEDGTHGLVDGQACRVALMHVAQPVAHVVHVDHAAVLDLRPQKEEDHERLILYSPRRGASSTTAA